MEVDQAIHARCAVRECTLEPVDEATLRRLIEAASLAPSAFNKQPWLFRVIQDKALLTRISVASKGANLAAPPTGISSNHLQEMGENPAFHIFCHAPVLVVISSATEGGWAVENCARAAEALAAKAAGLGIRWIGFAQSWVGTPERKAAGLSPDYLLMGPKIRNINRIG